MQDSVDWTIERFADVQILNYEVSAFQALTLKQKKLVYYLSMAGWAGRDIIYDQNYRHNLEIREALEAIFTKCTPLIKDSQWESFEVYLKRIWFSNGIHHHYSGKKFDPGFSFKWLLDQMQKINVELSDDAIKAIFDPAYDSKKCSKDANEDLVLNSAVNFYDPTIQQKEVEDYYKPVFEAQLDKPISVGLNSRLRKEANGKIVEEIYRANGKYGSCLKKMIDCLEKAKTCAENPAQENALSLLIDYYQTGSLETWDAFNIAWVASKEGAIDFIHGFTEVYEDPLSMKATFECIVQIKDLAATKAMLVITDNIQWFEDDSPIPDEYKKRDVQGISYSIMQVVAEAGDASPATPIGVNLPNADWIRADYGSKSVSLVNIEEAYEKVSGIELLKEFCLEKSELERAEKYGALASKIHTVLHEVVGHASGKLANGVKTPKQTLKSYANTIEEARADLVALYYLLDEQLVSWGIFSSMEVGKAAYDQFIRNGLLLQLRRVELGQDIEEDHMRNRQLIALWAFEKGMNEGIIEKVIYKGKVFFAIRNYQKLRDLFAKLLHEVQRIKSEGDYAAARELVEGYAVKVDEKIHSEVLKRVSKLNIPPYSGFVNPIFQTVVEGDQILDIDLSYPPSFSAQMLFYSENFSFLKP
jgi:dipeptidyl-peptidase III